MSNRDKILAYEKFQDSHKGETCVIIGNGPSLRDVDDEFLYKYPTFGTNLIVMRENFAPTYFTGLGVDHFDTVERAEAVWDILDHPNLKAAFLNRMRIYLFRHPKVWSVMSGNTYGLPNWEMDEDEQLKIRFSANPLENLAAFATTTYAEIQIAMYMGFTTILFVGLDHHYDVDDPAGQHFYTEGTQDVYDPPDYPWNLTEEYEVKANIAYRVASHVGEMLGVRLVNITPGSRCDIFEMGDIDDWK